MGFNTTVVILNDVLGWIEKDAGFGSSLASAVRAIAGNPRPIWVRVAGVGDAALVVETHHADEMISVVVGENKGAVLVDKDKNSHLHHFCFACGTPHDGFEDKYCDICGEAAQERRTLYDALRCIDITLRDSDDEQAKRARDLALEALIVAPHGERMSVLNWRAVLTGEITIEEAYEEVKERDRKRREFARCRKEEKGSDEVGHDDNICAVRVQNG